MTPRKAAKKKAPGKAKRKTASSRSRRRPSLARRGLGFAGRHWKVFGTAGFVLLALGVWFFLPFWQLSGQFSPTPRQQPSRLYAAGPRVWVGDVLRSGELVELLRARGYREAGASLQPGRYAVSNGDGGPRVQAWLRRFPTETGITEPAVLEARFRGPYLRELELDGTPVRSAPLDPLLVSSYLGPGLVERWPESIEELPQHLIEALLAAEDTGFFEHPGLSLSGIFRAVVANARLGRVDQGGSTLTQQLVKNIYLTHDRTWVRKAREAVLSILLELRYTKREILEAYLNEAYFGRSGGVELKGVGAAARAYFGVPATELSLLEAATLAGMIKSPGNLAPTQAPEAAATRRDVVLRRMADLGWLEVERAQSLLGAPIEVRTGVVDRKRARYAKDAASHEVLQRFSVGELADTGYTVLTTLDLAEQLVAEAAVRDGVAALEGEAKNTGGRTLQGALVSADPHTGGIRAYVGGRDYGESQYDRVRLARRQVGSAFKSVVLAAAFSERVATPATTYVDEPIEVIQAGNVWEPKNNDRTFQGRVTVRRAVEDSLNVPTIRLALDVGLETLADWATKLGVEKRLPNLPSVALGAVELSPRELLTVYSTFAAGGRRPALHLVSGVLDRSGEPVEGARIRPPEPVLEPAVAHMVTSVLEGAATRGTGRRLQTLGVGTGVAGKTGTTNGRKDSWFVGYSKTAATLVWVGYDDAAETRLSGSRAALPIWAEFANGTRPREGWGVFEPPPGIVSVAIDPLDGGRATGRCPEVVTEVFLPDFTPEYMCALHGNGRRWRDPERRRGFWRRLFGRNRDS